MPIYSADIKTRKASVAGQFSNSGGRIHPTDYVVDHQVNSLLPKLTEVDHQGGRIDLAKANLSIESAGIEQGDDCYTFIDLAPTDPLVDVLLIRPEAIGDRDAHTDTRGDCRAYIEEYQIPGSLSPWYLRGIHVEGMKALTLWSRVEAKLPQVGSTLFLGANGDTPEPIQIADFTFEEQPFSFGDAIYYRRIYHLTLTSRISRDLSGPEVTSVDPNTTLICNVREAMLAASNHYYGMAPLSVAAAADDTSVNVASIYGQVAPSARGEIPLSSVPAITSGTQTFASGGETFAISGPVHTQRQIVTVENRRATWTRTLLPIPASGGKVIAHVRILDRWYVVTEGETGTVGTITCNRNSGATLLTLSAFPDAGSWIVWEWPSAIHFTDRAGTATVDPLHLTFDLPGEAEAGTLVLEWPLGSGTATATENSAGMISGGANGYRVGTKVALYFTTLPTGAANITYSYQPLSTVTESLAGSLSGSVVTLTTAEPIRAGSLSVQWRVKRESSWNQKFVFKNVWPPIPETPGVPSNAVQWEGENDISNSDIFINIATDNGAGAIHNGTVIYSTGVVSFPALESFSHKTYETWKYANLGGDQNETGDWNTNTKTETLDGPFIVRYALAASIPGDIVTGEIAIPSMRLSLLRGFQDAIVPGTLRFRIVGSGTTVNYSDRDGVGGILYLSTGTVVGSVDYKTRTATITTWPGGVPALTVVSLVSTFGEFTLSELVFTTSSAPLAIGSFAIAGTLASGGAVDGSGGTDGAITGTGIAAGSTISHQLGMASVAFDAQVYPNSITYSATAFSIIPLDPDIIGINPVALPADGRVPIFRSGDYVVIFEDMDINLPNPAVAGASYNLGKSGLAFAGIEDGAGEQTYTCPGDLQPLDVLQIPKNGRTGALQYAVLEDAKARPVAGELYTADMDAWTLTLPQTFSAVGYDQPFVARFLPLVRSDDYEVNRDTGIITMATPLVLTGYTQPLRVRFRIHDLSVVVEAQTTGLITLQSPLTHDFTTAAAISAQLMHGDLVSRVTNIFQQHTDTGTWADDLVGAAPTDGGRYNATDYPIQVTNRGAIRERWRIKKTSTGWDVIGETMGVIMTWTGTATLNAKRNVSQAHPYFTLFYEGLGTGWATGNFVQFETYAAQGPFWILRTVRPGRPTVAVDSIRLRHRVGAD